MKVTKICAGEYTISVNGKTATVSKINDMKYIAWKVIFGEYGDEDYCTDMTDTLKEAKQMILDSYSK